MYILGSGFSKNAGLPLGTEIFGQILSEAKKTILYGNIIKRDMGKFIDFCQHGKGMNVNEADVELEQFISFLDIEHYLKLAGKDHWSDSGNKTQHAIKNIIARLLYCSREKISNWELYEAYGRSLLPGDIIITFNYDTLLETVLDSIGRSYVFSPDEFRLYCNDPNRDRPILILKLHGSLDWYSITPYKSRLQVSMNSQDQYWEHKHPIFSFSHEWKITRAFPYLDNKESALANIYRVDDVLSLQTETPSVTESPYVVSPSYSKIVYLNEIIDLWFGLSGWGNHCSTLTIIGFSLPEHDEYVRQVIYNIVENYLDTEDLKGIYTKPPLRFVDKISSERDEERLRQRYPFIEFGKSTVFKNGFGMECILTEDELKEQEIKS